MELGPKEEFTVNGKRAFVIHPKVYGPSRRWVWYAPTIGEYPNRPLHWYFHYLGAAGISVAGVDVGETYANDDARNSFRDFYAMVTRLYGLNRKACLLAQSRGALNHYSFAVAQPECVERIAGIYTVMDYRSYPGSKIAAEAFALSEAEFVDRLPELNPVSQIQRLASHSIPLFHIHGDQDDLVPLEANSRLAAERYCAAGGKIELEVVRGGRHEETPSFFQSPSVLNFLLGKSGSNPCRQPL